MIPENYKNRVLDNLKEKFAKEDSIKKRHIILNKYVAGRLRLFKQMMADKNVAKYYNMGELVLELMNDMELVSEHLKQTYSNITK